MPDKNHDDKGMDSYAVLVTTLTPAPNDRPICCGKIMMAAGGNLTKNKAEKINYWKCLSCDTEIEDIPNVVL